MENEHKHFPGDPLSQVFAFDELGRTVWPVQDMRRMLRLQLGSKLHLELSRAGVSERQTVLQLADAATPRVRSFSDLLFHPWPPTDLLFGAKEYAKLCKDSSHSPMAPEIALHLYYCAIASALLRRNQKITSLGDDELRHGLNWLISQAWIDDRSRVLIRGTLDHIRQGRHHWRLA